MTDACELDGGASPQERPLCEGCGKAPSKYCCPGCNRRSCSLDCVKAHKEETGCTGKRDRTAFVGRSQWDERHLLSDYRFLEDVKLADDVAKRTRPPAPKQELPAFLQTLTYQARRRGVQLHILAPGMAKRVHNSTRFDPRQKVLRWHVEWNFVAAGCKVTDQRVHENTKMVDVLRQHLTLQPGQALKHHQLREYVEVGVGGLVVVMRKERTPANAAEYHAIDLNQVLSKQLVGKVVVEYPTFLVLLPHQVPQYTLAAPPPALPCGSAAPAAGAGAGGADAGASAAAAPPGAAGAVEVATAPPSAPGHAATAASPAAPTAAAGSPKADTASSGDGSTGSAGGPPCPTAVSVTAASAGAPTEGGDAAAPARATGGGADAGSQGAAGCPAACGDQTFSSRE